MHSYILESGQALGRTLREARPALDEVGAEARRRGCKKVILSGVGSSYTAGWAAKFAFDEVCPLTTYLLPSTELSYYPNLVGSEALVAILSRSGERKFVIDAMEWAEGAGSFTVAMTGAAGSLMADKASRVVLTAEGPEASFPKTKSVTAGMGAFLGLAAALSDPDDPRTRNLEQHLRLLPALVDQAVELAAAPVAGVVDNLLKCTQVIVAGTGGNAGAAMETDIKLQESALVTTQWMDTGNLVHGPLCLLDESWLAVVLATEQDAKLASDAVRLVKALGGRTLVLAPDTVRLDTEPDHLVPVPLVPSRTIEAPVYLAPLQLLAYHWTVAKGLDPDKPQGADVIMNAMLPEGRVEAEARG